MKSEDIFDGARIAWGLKKSDVDENMLDDFQRLVGDLPGPLVTEKARLVAQANGIDPDKPSAHMSDNKLGRVKEKILSMIAGMHGKDRSMTLDTALLDGKENEDIEFPGGIVVAPVIVARDELVAMGYSVVQFALFDGKKRDKITRRLERRIADHYPRYTRAFIAEVARLDKERSAFHDWLYREWAKVPLSLEAPRASWLKYLVDNDFISNVTQQRTSLLQRKWEEDKMQSIVVENNWGAADLPALGEWRLPYPDIAWEFHLSGVRVIVFTSVQPGERILMAIAFGKGGTWVADDHQYTIVPGCLPQPEAILKNPYPVMQRVLDFAYRNIRAACIMLEAEVAERVRVTHESQASVIKRGIVGQESKRPLRDHYIVRLLHRTQHLHVRTARSAGASTGNARAPQRGHWRQGTWVHFDDPDSGREQYANDGGFFVSKTWRKWHFAGDPKNILHKEYRL